ncbi:MAG: glycosyltransferase family 4 protein [Nitrospirae bacterium]|nr:glycosyltransferase family 4 protein [Nitrospirota bacterium]
MKNILILVNWDVHKTLDDNLHVLQSPNILERNKKYWFFKYWPEKETKVDVIDYSKLPVIHPIEKNLLRFYVVQTLKASLKLRKYDLIISHGVQSAIFLAFIRSLFGIKNTPHLIIDVGCLNGGRSRQPELSMFQFSMKSVAGLVYHVSSQKKHYDRYFPFLSKKAFFVPFGVDTEFFKPLNVKQEDYILSIGYKFRNWLTLINAYSQIKTKTALKIVGPEDLNIELPKNVYLQPYVPINTLKELIAKSKFVVLPLVSLPYAHGQMTLLQSMAMGKAVIVTKVPSTVDYINDLEDALFVRLNDVDDMRNKIEFLLHNPDEIFRLGENARKTIENKFTEKHMAEGIYKAIRDLGA